jgi:hypothetical protein
MLAPFAVVASPKNLSLDDHFDRSFLFMAMKGIELSQDGNAFTATATFEVFDANGNLLQTGCLTETATHLE